MFTHFEYFNDSQKIKFLIKFKIFVKLCSMFFIDLFYGQQNQLLFKL
jgi:hypothetical protein